MTDEDYRTVYAMSAHGGSFVHALAQVAFLADEENLARLKAAWPEYWKQYTEMAALRRLNLEGA